MYRSFWNPETASERYVNRTRGPSASVQIARSRIVEEHGTAERTPEVGHCTVVRVVVEGDEQRSARIREPCGRLNGKIKVHRHGKVLCFVSALSWRGWAPGRHCSCCTLFSKSRAACMATTTAFFRNMKHFLPVNVPIVLQSLHSFSN